MRGTVGNVRETLLKISTIDDAQSRETGDASK
jgi:hypothetical protein